MFIATFIFWLGRNKFVHIPANGRRLLKELKSSNGLQVIGKLTIVYVFVAVFWSLYEQTASSSD